MSGDHNQYQKPDYVDRRQWKYDPMTGEPLGAGREPEPVAWVAYENGEKHGIDFDEDEIAELPVGTMLYPIPPNFLDPAKVARLMDEAFERGKKEIDMEQMKDIAQKLADCAVLNSAPPQREWQDLTDDESDEIWGECLGVFDCLKMTQAKLKEKNT